MDSDSDILSSSPNHQAEKATTLAGNTESLTRLFSRVATLEDRMKQLEIKVNEKQPQPATTHILSEAERQGEAAVVKMAADKLTLIDFTYIKSTQSLVYRFLQYWDMAADFIQTNNVSFPHALLICIDKLKNMKFNKWERIDADTGRTLLSKWIKDENPNAGVAGLKSADQAIHMAFQDIQTLGVTLSTEKIFAEVFYAPLGFEANHTNMMNIQKHVERGPMEALTTRNAKIFSNCYTKEHKLLNLLVTKEFSDKENSKTISGTFLATKARRVKKQTTVCPSIQ